jgi:hypothetical protein
MQPWVKQQFANFSPSLNAIFNIAHLQCETIAMQFYNLFKYWILLLHAKVKVDSCSIKILALAQGLNQVYGENEAYAHLKRSCKEYSFLKVSFQPF